MPLPPELIGRLYDSHVRSLVLYARQLCDDPEDAVQQAFLKLADQTTLPEAPLAWLYRVVRNEALMASRATQRRQRREQEATRIKGDWFQPPSSEAINASAVTRAFGLLPLEQREIVTSHIWGGLSFREIGALLGISDSTVHRRYQETIALLRAEVESSCHQNK